MNMLTKITVDNGIDVDALLGAREALIHALDAATFTCRARCEWQCGTHSIASIEGCHGLGAEQKHKTAFSFSADPTEELAAQDNGITPVEYVLVGLASCLTAGIASVFCSSTSGALPMVSSMLW